MTENYAPAAHSMAPNPLAAELEARLRAMPEGGTGLWLPREEIQALIDSMNYQDGKIAGHIDFGTYMKKELDAARAAVAADQTLISRMIAVIKLARHFAMRPLALQGDTATKDYLARYSDRGDWGPLAWPDGIEQAGQARIGLGYLRIDGFVERPEGPKEGKENDETN